MAASDITAGPSMRTSALRDAEKARMLEELHDPRFDSPSASPFVADSLVGSSKGDARRIGGEIGYVQSAGELSEHTPDSDPAPLSSHEPALRRSDSRVPLLPPPP